jgi:hypothetical protein
LKEPTMTDAFTPAENLSSFRRIAAAMWKRPSDPSIYGSMDVDVTETLRFIDRFRAETGRRLTMTHVVAHALARVFARHPELNAKIRFGARVELRRTVDLFVSVATDGGKDLSGARIASADQLDLSAMIDAVEKGARGVRRGEDPGYQKSRDTLRAMPWWLTRPALALTDLLTNELHLDLPKHGMPRDPFGTAVVTNVGSFGIDTAFAPLHPRRQDVDAALADRGEAAADGRRRARRGAPRPQAVRDVRSSHRRRLRRWRRREGAARARRAPARARRRAVALAQLSRPPPASVRSSTMTAFDYFIALDGNCLNGFEGLAGVARLSCDPARDRWDIDVRYFDGLAGGHALQLSPAARWASWEPLADAAVLRAAHPARDPAPLDPSLRRARHLLQQPDARGVDQRAELHHRARTRLLPIRSRRPRAPRAPRPPRRDLAARAQALGLGPIPLLWRHGSRPRWLRQPSGRLRSEDRHPRVVGLPATVWHLGAHPTRDVFYAPTQRCAPQGHGEFCEYTIAHFKNYLFEIDGPSASVTRHLSIPKDWPGALTSDVVVTETHVLYNACASGALIEVDLETLTQLRFIDERPGPLAALKGWRTAANNVIRELRAHGRPGQYPRPVEGAARDALLRHRRQLRPRPEP